MNIKSLLKKNKIIYNLNASIKAARTETLRKRFRCITIKRLTEQRISYDKSLVPQLVRERLAKRGIASKKCTQRSTENILGSGASKRQDHSGFILKRLESFRRSEAVRKS